MAKIGRPSKYDAIDLKKVEVLASFGLIDTEIAMVLDISESTLAHYKKKPEFSQSLKKGKIKADLKIVESLYKKATQGDTTAIIFWLKNRRPDEWRDNRDINLKTKLNIELTAAEIWKARKEAEKKMGKGKCKS
ncbi:MAG TPA: hypothetical protein ENN61_03025 [Bacteroidaceae bacterium]|nr:hypothetical protein [Bacteroidaceae bacterium]